MKPQKNIITLTITNMTIATRTRRGRLQRIYNSIMELIRSFILEINGEFTLADVHVNLRDKLGLSVAKYVIENVLLKLRNEGRIEKVPRSARAIAFPRTYAYQAKPAIAKGTSGPAFRSDRTSGRQPQKRANPEWRLVKESFSQLIANKPVTNQRTTISKM